MYYAGDRTYMSVRVSMIVDEAVHAFTHHQSGTDEMSRVLRMRLILKMIDELRHSTDGITCRLIKSDQTIVSKNGHLVNVIQYFELSMKDAMFTINDRLKRKKRVVQGMGNSLEE
jgi:VanZ family protein